MNPRVQVRMLPDGRRLHMSDGPIDLILEAFGAPGEVEAAYAAAIARFQTVLDELCAELVYLRQPARVDSAAPTGRIAQRMLAAVRPYANETFITPMAAVAGAVAEETLEAMTSVANLPRAFVNDGGDIALYLAKSEMFNIGLVDRPERPSLFGTATIDSASPVRGIATSGWRGRSFSLGIADAVTVLAATASMADAAATIIANAVDLPGNPKVTRIAARELAPDSDLAGLLVTQSVGPLTPEELHAALSAGSRKAESLQTAGLISAAALHLQGETLVVSWPVLESKLDVQRSLVHA